MEHKARPPARFSALRSPTNTTIHPLEYAKTPFLVYQRQLMAYCLEHEGTGEAGVVDAGCDGSDGHDSHQRHCFVE